MLGKGYLSWKILFLIGLILSGIGIYFIFFRPVMLPEDIRFLNIESRSEEISQLLGTWLNYVFMVLGGYVFTTGLLVVYLSITHYRSLKSGSMLIASISGFSSLGLMSWVNFQLHSDFRWLLLVLAILWQGAIVVGIYEIQKLNRNKLQMI